MPLFIILSFVISATLIPIVIYICKKESWYDSENERKVHTGKIPRLGSVGFVPAFAICALLYYLTNTNTNTLELLPIIISGLLIFIFGIIDVNSGEFILSLEKPGPS